MNTTPDPTPTPERVEAAGLLRDGEVTWTTPPPLDPAEWMVLPNGTPPVAAKRSELGVVVGALLNVMPDAPLPRIVAARHGWELGEVIDAVDERTGSQKWGYFSGLSAADDRHRCEVCGVWAVEVRRSIIEAHRDPTEVIHLACGHALV